ncbi:hypothetical protein D187_003485 [Cystobacter fuscus DSM 2262]|uniref:Uncharacterized protein n=1 Tax=Cystobacter fuscus (strain ATCC 25194 / DSM 2262 / NBRC 100088 / M29) TaxID=1242864 RepID=S9QR94_CYSF2|nr:hypothetical protein [Cystobacter fuscus]EPX59108.1 hypothetical protein D187_003485 [Cystobacter fuscus DSM 2262]
MRLSDKTGKVPRALGLVGVLALIATVMWMPEAPPEPEAEAPEPSPAPRQEMPEPPPPIPSGTVQRLRRLVPVFPGAQLIPMGQLQANGNPMEMGFFEVKASAREVMDFYIQQFEQRGRRVVEQPDGSGGGAVNYYDEKLGALVTVNVMAGGTQVSPSARVFPAIVEAPEGIHLKAEPPEMLPQPTGLVTVLRVDDQNPGPAKDSSTLTQIARGSPRELAGFYRKEMAVRGYSAVGGRSDKDVEVLDFERRGERVSVTLSAMNTKEGSPETIIAVVMETKQKEVRP